MRDPLFGDGARAEPPRPLLELALLFGAFYLAAYVPADPSAMGAALGRASFHIQNLALLAPRALFLLYFMLRSDGACAFGLRRPEGSDAFRALGTALGALALALAGSFALGGTRNPFLAAAAGGGDSPLLLVPLVLASSLAVGYGEELFFRAYAIRRLEQAGFPAIWAAVASSLAFGSAHGLQGLAGLVLATLLGLWFAWRWIAGRRIHEIALGHAMYDAAVMLAAVYAGATPLG